MVNWFFTRVPRELSGERRTFLTNGVKETGYPHAKDLAGPLLHTINKN